MATIEPRLMHLLNNSNASPDSSPYHTSTDLPPIQSFSSFAKNSNISLPPLEPDGAPSHHEKSAAPKAKAVHHIPPLSSITEEYNNSGRYSHDGGTASGSMVGPATGGPTLRQHANGGRSLRMLFDNPEINDSQVSLPHFFDEMLDPSIASMTEDASTKKRHRAMTVKDDIMHLPQPLKKQKSSQNIVPPIINGLYEPPPNAAVFPPIACDDGGNEAVAPAARNTLKEYNHSNASTSTHHVEMTEAHDAAATAPVDTRQETAPPAPEAEKPQARLKRKAAKPRKKWSEEETRHLLLGVNKYGVGKWTSILEDPGYRFNGRTAGDLKDRFRTCCPDELRIVPSKSRESLNSQDKPTTANVSPTEKRLTGNSKKPLLLEDILANPEEIPRHQSSEDLAMAALQGQAGLYQHDCDSNAKPKKSRAHRKKIEDLQAMGIHGPFKKSHRRERRPFTTQDDEQILEGLHLYGPAWTKIQRDPRFDLSSRQPTDLRDRVRNKYPDMYKQIEEKQVPNGKDPVPAVPAAAGTAVLPTRAAPPSMSNLLEPPVNNLINENSLPTLDSHLHRSGSREEMMPSKWSGQLPSASASGGAPTNGSFYEGLDSISRETPEGEGGEVGDGGEQSSSAVFGMMDISRLLLN